MNSISVKMNKTVGRILPGLLTLAFLSSLSSLNTPTRAQEKAADPWDRLPAILAAIKAPTFPARDCVITSFGAKPDGVTEAAEAIRQAIADCARKGGGRVVVPAGDPLQEQRPPRGCHREHVCARHRDRRGGFGHRHRPSLRRIYRAIKAGDAEKARDEMGMHLALARQAQATEEETRPGKRVVAGESAPPAKNRGFR